jgi:hypothetical protein
MSKEKTPIEEQAKRYLNGIGFDSSHMEVHFNNDDKSYYEVYELMASFARECALDYLPKSEVKELIKTAWNEGIKSDNPELLESSKQEP